MELRIARTWTLALIAPVFAGAQSTPPPAQLPDPCESMAETQQFNFWIGEWIVTAWQGAFQNGREGHSKIQAILGHCAILENWTGPTGSEGKSLNFYDTNIRKWRQSWMSDQGGALTYSGEYRDRAMRFDGWTVNAASDTTLQRLTFFNVAPDTVRQLFEASTDRGKTWKSTFDARYVRVRPTP